MCGSKKSKFIKKQEAKGLLSNLGIRAPSCFVLSATTLNYKMNGIINKFLLAGDKFMPEMHLRQPGFTYSSIY